MPAFKIEHEGDGFYTIKDVPIFQTHNDRGFDCNEDWLKAALTNYELQKAEGHRPVVIIGHNVKGVEKEAVGFLDNLAIKGRKLYADLVRIPKMIKEKIVQNAYPSRSVEILPKSKRVLALALLGGTPPYFSLPQMTYEHNEPSVWYRSPNMNGFTDEQKQELQEMIANSMQYALHPQQEQAAVYTLSDEQVYELLNNGEVPEVYQDENGQAYIQDVQGNYYTVSPVAYATLAQLPAKAGRFKGAAGKIGKGAKKAAVAAGLAGLVTAPATIPWAVGNEVGKRGGKQSFLGDALGGPFYGVGVRGGRRKAGYEYSIDENTGIVYADGEAIGEVALYEDNTLATEGMQVPTAQYIPEAVPQPSAATVVPQIDPSMATEEFETDPRLMNPVPEELDEGNVDELDRMESDQFSLYDHPEFYDLARRLQTAENANALLIESRRAEKYHAWLESAKAQGVPVGNVKQTVDYMMSQSPEQAEKYMQLLQNQPKIALGEKSQIFTLEPSDKESLRADYMAHRREYAACGVDEKDLQYADYVRINK